MGFYAEFMKVSILIRAYNSEKTIGRSVKSAVEQKFPTSDFEIIVVNDGSTDKTLMILDTFRTVENLKIFNQKNMGKVAAANKAFELATGKYFVLLDSDDFFEQSLIKDLSTVLDTHQEIDFVYCDYWEVNNKERWLVSPETRFETLAVGVMFKRKKFKSSIVYRDLFFAEYDLILREFKDSKSYHLQKPLFTYNRHPMSLTADEKLVEKGLKELKRMHPAEIESINKIRDYKFSI